MCHNDVHRIETQCMVVIMTVLSLCTQTECGFQREISAEEEEKTGATVAAAAQKIATAAAAIPATGVAAVALAEVALAASVAAGAAAATTYYVGRYFYKRFTWTNEAKEIEFKRQFVAHVTKKLLQNVDSTSANCSNQVEQ